MPSWMWIQNVVFPILGMGLGAFAMVGIYKTVNRWLDRRHERAMAEHGGADPALIDAVQALRARMEQLEDQGLRIQELEERLDFAERVLSRRDQRPGLPGSV